MGHSNDTQERGSLSLAIIILVLVLVVLPITLAAIRYNQKTSAKAAPLLDYTVNLIYLRPSDQPERPDLQQALQREFHGTLRLWYGQIAGKSWKPGSFRYVISTKKSEAFARDNAYEATQDLQFNHSIALWPHDDPIALPYWTRKKDDYAVIAPFTQKPEINIIFVQTNQLVCDDGASYIPSEQWGVVTLEGAHLNNLAKAAGFDATLPPWNTTDQTSLYYNWRSDAWRDPVVDWCYRSWPLWYPKPNQPISNSQAHYDTTMGKLAHETGHSLGLDHPPVTSPDFANTVIGSGWQNWPNTTLVQYQRDQLLNGFYLTIPCVYADRGRGACVLADTLAGSPTPVPTITPISTDCGRSGCRDTIPSPTSVPTPCLRGCR